MPDGRTRAYLNDAPISAQTLREVSRQLVEIHGQHDDRALVDPAAHRVLVDAYGGLEAEVRTVRDAFAARRAAERLHAEEEARHRARRRADADYLRHVHDELAEARSPCSARRRRWRRAGPTCSRPRRSRATCATRRRASAATDRRCPPCRRCCGGSSAGPCRPRTSIEPCLQALDGAPGGARRRHAASTRRCAADFDPRELETVEERLFALRAAARKHNVSADALPALCDRFTATSRRSTPARPRLAASARRRGRAGRVSPGSGGLSRGRARGRGQARRGRQRRTRRPEARARPVRHEIEPDPGRAGPTAIDRVEFWVSTNPAPGPGR